MFCRCTASATNEVVCCAGVAVGPEIGDGVVADAVAVVPAEADAEVDGDAFVWSIVIGTMFAMLEVSVVVVGFVDRVAVDDVAGFVTVVRFGVVVGLVVGVVEGDVELVDVVVGDDELI